MVSVHPLTGRIGAEIDGVDLRRPISADLADALRDALARRLVLFFRDQHLDIPAQKRLTEVFGPLARSVDDLALTEHDAADRFARLARPAGDAEARNRRALPPANHSHHMR